MAHDRTHDTTPPQAQHGAEEIEWTADDERAADEAWAELDAELRKEEAEGKKPMDEQLT